MTSRINWQLAAFSEDTDNSGQTKLPSPFPPSNPETLLKVQKLLVDSRFLRKLRQIGELKLLTQPRSKLDLSKHKFSSRQRSFAQIRTI